MATKKRKGYAYGIATYWGEGGDIIIGAGMALTRKEYLAARERLIELDEQPNRYLALTGGGEIPDVPGVTKFTDDGSETDDSDLTDPAEGWLGDSYMGAWDDDPSPYDGTYSEM